METPVPLSCFISCIPFSLTLVLLLWFTFDLNCLFFFLYSLIFYFLIFLRASVSRYNGSNLSMDREVLTRDQSGMHNVFILITICFLPILNSVSILMTLDFCYYFCYYMILHESLMFMTFYE